MKTVKRRLFAVLLPLLLALTFAVPAYAWDFSLIELWDAYGLSEAEYRAQARTLPRPGEMDINYAGESGSDLVTVDSPEIYLESSGVLRNPITGEVCTVLSQSYDYELMYYTLQLSDGSEWILEYQGSYLFVGAVGEYEVGSGFGYRTVYVYIDSSVPHEHNWKTTVFSSATCTAPGREQDLCISCGETVWRDVPALGHDWQIKEELAGSTLYECSRCQETTEKETGTQPGPGDGSGSGPGEDDKEDGGIWDKLVELIGVVFDGIIGIIERVAQKLFDALHALIDLVSGGFSAVVHSILSIFIDVPGMFGRFLNFLTTVFSLIPPEVVTLMKFSIMAAVLVGVIKAVRR